MQQLQPPTYEQFCAMVPACLSPDQTTQKQAEQAFATLKNTFPAQYISYSLKSLQEQTDQIVFISFFHP